MDESNHTKWLPKFLRSSISSPTSTPPNETSSLLPKPADPHLASSTSEGETYEIEDGSPAKQWLSEFLLLLRGSIPVIIAYTLQNSLQTLSVLIVGRLSPEALATAAFSYMFAMSTAWLIALGGSTALDTLASSSFTGSKDPHDLGVLLQRGFIVLTAFYIPVAILWACSAPVFRLLGQEEYICVDSAKFLTALIPGGLGYVYFECMKKYLQAQGCSCSPFSITSLMVPQRSCALELTSFSSPLPSTFFSTTSSYIPSTSNYLAHHSQLESRTGFPSFSLSYIPAS
jgi:MATE family multidrug resistance protein